MDALSARPLRMYVPLPARRPGAVHCAYPEHLRPWGAPLPRAPGVHVFHGEEDRVPLYIGKSVNIRQRVLDHMRTPEQARLLRATRRIELRQPLHNKQLRRRRQLCSIRLLCGRPEVVHSHETPFAST